MSGAVEEAGKVATGFFSAMGSQPVMLGLVVLNLALVAMMYAVLNFSQQARKTEFEMIFAQQKDVQRLLATCTVPEDKRSKIVGPTEAQLAQKKKDAWRLQSEESRPVELAPDGSIIDPPPPMESIPLPPVRPIPRE